MTDRLRKIDHALALAKSGFRVFPLTPGSKIPPKDFPWKAEATIDVATIERWWSAEPDYNIGVAPGADTIIVDADTKKGKPGLASLAMLDSMDLPESFRVSTPSGGTHVYLKTTEKHRNRVDSIEGFDGVDIRSDGGYVLGPGSIVDGRPYAVTTGDLGQIEVAPRWFDEILLRNPTKHTKKSEQPLVELDIAQPIFAAKDGATVGSVLKPKGMPGHLVLLPYFDMIEHDTADPEMWSDEAERLSHGIVAQLIAVDRGLKAEGAVTPPPKWLASARVPKQVEVVSKEVARIDAEIGLLVGKKEEKLAETEALMAHSRLLFETGKPLEAAIEAALQLLGFTVENYRAGDVEIDHIFVGPSGIRMIGESEGKENSSVDINKFRQLESNINEDFQREEVIAPAKGVLFGNAYRFTEPALRKDRFTAKCLTNAKRLGTALVRTSDLYDAIVFALDHPNDHRFVENCRMAIEETSGGIVVFPAPLCN